METTTATTTVVMKVTTPGVGHDYEWTHVFDWPFGTDKSYLRRLREMLEHREIETTHMPPDRLWPGDKITVTDDHGIRTYEAEEVDFKLLECLDLRQFAEGTDFSDLDRLEKENAYLVLAAVAVDIVATVGFTYAVYKTVKWLTKR